MKNIKVNTVWTKKTVWETCKRSHLYTKGTNNDYWSLFDLVESLEPDVDGLYLVALDIKEHSEGQTVSNVMHLLNKEAIVTTYSIEGEEN